MSELQVLVWDWDEPRARRYEARLRGAGHAVTVVDGSADALEALFVQRFDVCVIGPTQNASEAGEFLAAMRQLEAGQRSHGRMIVLVCGDPAGYPQADGTLELDFSAAELAAAVAGATGQQLENGNGTGRANLALFEPDGFREQCVEEAELMIEIIDLFGQESERELPEMAEALGSGDYDRLYRLAHTIKGSLGALHAPRARQQAFELENAARSRNAAESSAALAALAQEIEQLEGPLSAFRQLCCQD